MEDEANKISNIINNSGLRKTEELSVSVSDVVLKIVKQHCDSIDVIIRAIRQMLKDETTVMSDQEIEDILLQLPIVLYDAMEGQETVGIQLDLANQLYKEAQSEAYRLARGTISDKTAAADIKTRSEQLDKIIYDRAYKIIKGKMEMAVETLNAVKKVQSSRQQRYDGVRQDLNKFRSF